MKRTVINLFIATIAVIFASCEKTGYVEPEQKDVVRKLTGVKWVCTSFAYPDSKPEIYETESLIYNFDTTGKGWCKYVAQPGDKDAKDIVENFQWSFTNDTFAVLYYSDGYSVTYWLIERLTETELKVRSSNQDPVIYPNSFQTVYTFKSSPK